MRSQEICLTRERLAAAVGDWFSAADIDAAVRDLNRNGGRLSPDGRGIPTDLARAVRREQIIVGTLKAASELGYGRATVQDVLVRGKVPRATFYEHFASKEDCFVAAFDSAAAHLVTQIETAVRESDRDGHERLRAGLEAVLRFVDTEPGVARTVFVEVRACPAAWKHQRALLDRFAKCLADQKQDETALGIAGGIEALLAARIHQGKTEDIWSLLPALLHFATLRPELPA